MSGVSVETAGTSVSRIFAMRLACVLASNARRPVAISYRIVPSAKMSVRASAGAPCTCSGAMYWQRADDRALCRARPGRCGEHRERLPGRADGVLREAEIEQLGARRREHDVPGLQIPMDDALPVCRLKGVRDLDAEAEYLCERQRSTFETCRQRLTFEQFEHEVLGVVLAADVVQAADVRVIERGDRLGLALEAGAELRVGRQLRREHLHRDLAVKARITGLIHLAHASGPDQRENLVGAKPCTGLQGHVLADYTGAKQAVRLSSPCALGRGERGATDPSE